MKRSSGTTSRRGTDESRPTKARTHRRDGSLEAWTLPLPKKRDGTIDKDRIHGMFWASPYYEWAPFAESLKWDIVQTYHALPVAHWVREKIAELEFIRSQKLRHAIFKTRHEYDDRVIEAMEKLPQVADVALGIYMEAAIQFRDRMKSKERKDRPTVGETKLMIDAADKVIEMKQRALLMNKFSVEFVRREVMVPPAQQVPRDEQTKAESSDALDIEIVGVEGKMKGSDLTKFMMQYIDQLKDQSQPAPAEGIPDHEPEPEE